MKFRERRATQAALYLLTKSGGEIQLYFLIKMLYYADRKALIHGSRPITGDRMVSMPMGPVLSRCYNLAKGDAVDTKRSDGYWVGHIVSRRPDSENYVRIKQMPIEWDELTEFEIKLLDESYDLVANRLRMNVTQVKNFFESYKEWDRRVQTERPQSRPIEPETILKNSGKTDARLKEIIELERTENFISRIESR